MDVTETTETTEFDPVEALTKAWTAEDAPAPKKEEEELSEADKDTNEDHTDEHAKDDAEKSDEEVQDEDGEDEGEADGEGEDEAEGKSYVDSDDAYVKVKVDGEEREFAVKDLKRLAGQEASLTRKSQEVAKLRESVDGQNQANAARLNGLLQRALERWKPYEQVNLLVAAKTLEPEQLQALQTDMQARWEDIQFLQQESDALTQHVRKAEHETLVNAARECIKTLSDPEKGIKGWDEQLYGDLCTYAKDTGVSSQLLNSLTDPAAFKIIQKAMLYDKGVKTVQKTKVQQGKQKTPPKKIVKSSNSPEGTKSILKPSKVQEATRKLAQTGTRDDAEAALMAMWGGDE